jgi:hypothetical protein
MHIKIVSVISILLSSTAIAAPIHRAEAQHIEYHHHHHAHDNSIANSNTAQAVEARMVHQHLRNRSLPLEFAYSHGSQSQNGGVKNKEYHNGKKNKNYGSPKHHHHQQQQPQQVEEQLPSTEAPTVESRDFEDELDIRSFGEEMEKRGCIGDACRAIGNAIGNAAAKVHNKVVNNAAGLSSGQPAFSGGSLMQNAMHGMNAASAAAKKAGGRRP